MPPSPPTYGPGATQQIQNDPTKMGAVLIIGAGVGGLTAAVALQKAAFKVQVFDRVPDLREAPTGLIIQSNAMKALGNLDLAEPVRAAGVVLRRALLRSYRGSLLLELPLEAMTRELATPVVALARAKLRSVLLANLGAGVVYLSSIATRFEIAGADAKLHFANGQVVDGAAILGADGLHSRIRTQLFGGQEPRYAGYTSWRGITLPGDYGDASTALEHWGPGSRFGLAPIGEGCMSWYATANSPPGETDDPAQRRVALLKRFHGWPAPIAKVIEQTPDALISRVDVYDREPVSRWGDGPVSLLGDAAHPMTPDMAQGACQAIEDGVVLADSFTWSRHAIDGLRMYERRRMPRVHWFVEESRRFGKSAQMENSIARWFRDASMRMMPGATIQRAKTAMTFTL